MAQITQSFIDRLNRLNFSKMYEGDFFLTWEKTDEELEAYHQRMVDRFGPVPHEGEELMQVVKLRRLGKLLGCEKIVLKQNRMQMQLVSTPDSPYYQSDAFEKIINYMMTNPRRCTLKEARGHRMAVVSEVKTVREAVDILSQI